MISLCRCTQCNKSRTFDITLKFDHEIKLCNECHDVKVLFYTYNFCNTICFFEWLHSQQIEALGFPCQTCFDRKTLEPTGLFGGQNCPACSGTKRIKTSKLPWSNHG